jgi:hypothetical protein
MKLLTELLGTVPVENNGVSEKWLLLKSQANDSGEVTRFFSSAGYFLSPTIQGGNRLSHIHFPRRVRNPQP